MGCELPFIPVVFPHCRKISLSMSVSDEEIKGCLKKFSLKKKIAHFFEDMRKIPECILWVFHSHTLLVWPH